MYIAVSRESSWCQFVRHWRQHRSSLWHPVKMTIFCAARDEFLNQNDTSVYVLTSYEVTDGPRPNPVALCLLTHWGRVTHICVGNLTIIGQDNGLSPGRHQAIIWTNAGVLLTGPWGTNLSEISIDIQTFSFKKMHLKMSSAKWRPFCLGLNVLIDVIIKCLSREVC